MLVRVGQEVQALSRRLGRGRLLLEIALAALSLLVFVLLAHAMLAQGRVAALDDDVARRAAEGVPLLVEWWARALTYLGGAVGTSIVTVASCLVLLHRRRPFDAAFVGLSVVGITVLVAILKAAFERPRPDLGSPIPLPHSFSFPSGHAATATVLYGALGLLLAEQARTGARAAAWLAGAGVLALGIGWSRVLLNVHYVSDVLAGLAVGLAWLCCCAIVREVAARREGAARLPH